MVLPTFRHKSYARLTKNEREPREPERFRAERVSRKRDLDIDWERNFPPLVFIIHGCICCKNEMDEMKEKGSEIVPMINKRFSKCNKSTWKGSMDANRMRVDTICIIYIFRTNTKSNVSLIISSIA